MLETVDELAEALADLCGIYNQGLRFDGKTLEDTQRMRAQGDTGYDHAEDCGCRMCWTGRMEHRIRQAVRNEARLAQPLKERTDATPDA